MVLKGLFGRRPVKPRITQDKSNLVNLNEKADLRIQKQLASCMKDIQRLMLHQKAELKQKTKVRVTLQLV